MIDKDKMIMKQFPADVVIKDHIQGSDKSNYELFLVEFLNKSPYFMQKTDGVEFQYNTDQSHGECDCYSDDYGIDFKLLGSESSFMAQSLLSLQEVEITNGISVKAPKGRVKELPAIRLHAALKKYNLNELLQIEINDLPSKKDDNYLLLRDIKSVLDTVSKHKNMLFFMNYYITYDSSESIDEKEVIAFLTDGLEMCFSTLFEYRYMKCGECFETFISIIYESDFVVFKVTNGKFAYVDKVSVGESETFKYLNRYTFPPREYMKRINSVTE